MWICVSCFGGGDEHGSHVCCPLCFWLLCGQLANALGFHFCVIMFLVGTNHRASSGREGGWEEARVCSFSC